MEARVQILRFRVRLGISPSGNGTGHGAQGENEIYIGQSTGEGSFFLQEVSAGFSGVRTKLENE